MSFSDKVEDLTSVQEAERSNLGGRLNLTSKLTLLIQCSFGGFNSSLPCYCDNCRERLFVLLAFIHGHPIVLVFVAYGNKSDSFVK